MEDYRLWQLLLAQRIHLDLPLRHGLDLCLDLDGRHHLCDPQKDPCAEVYRRLFFLGLGHDPIRAHRDDCCNVPAFRDLCRCGLRNMNRRTLVWGGDDQVIDSSCVLFLCEALYDCLCLLYLLCLCRVRADRLCRVANSEKCY